MNILLRSLIVFISAVSVYDIYCTVLLNDSLDYFEENNIASSMLTTTERHIVHMKYGHYLDYKTVDVSKLVAVKAAGLAISISLMQWTLTSMKRKMATAIIVPVSAGMLCLLVYLTI